MILFVSDSSWFDWWAKMELATDVAMSASTLAIIRFSCLQYKLYLINLFIFIFSACHQRSLIWGHILMAKMYKYHFYRRSKIRSWNVHYPVIVLVLHANVTFRHFMPYKISSNNAIEHITVNSIVVCANPSFPLFGGLDQSVRLMPKSCLPGTACAFM